MATEFASPPNVEEDEPKEIHEDHSMPKYSPVQDTKVQKMASTTLNDESFEVLLRTLSKLQDVIGHRTNVKFPRIAAVGNQSSGKSSVIQGLIGREILPRGTDIVTRCPLMIRVHQLKDRGQKERVEFPAEPDYHLGSAYFDEANLHNVIKEINIRTDKRTRDKRIDISNEEIQIDFYSAKYPDLQFVDLPGFTKTSVRGQQDNIEEQVLELVKSYMVDKNTIILAIMDGSQDLALSEALKWAEHPDVDPKGERTIAVLTKLDKLNEATDYSRVVRYILNEVKPLELGYVGIVNRSQTDIENNISIEEAKKNELTVMTRPDFRRIKHRMGIDFLRKTLIGLMAERIRDLLPRLKIECNEDLERILLKLELLDVDPDKKDQDDTDKEDLVLKLVESTIAGLRKELNGQDIEVRSDNYCLGTEINSIVKRGTIEKSLEAKHKHSLSAFHDQLTTAIQNIHAVRDPLLASRLAFEKGIQILTEAYRRPFKTLINSSAEHLKKGVDQIVTETLLIYPKFKELTSSILMEQIAQNKMKTDEYVDALINVNQMFVNTEHVEFLKTTTIMRKSGIRFQNPKDEWFKKDSQGEPANPRQTDDDDARNADNGIADQGSNIGAGVGEMVGNHLAGPIGGILGGMAGKAISNIKVEDVTDFINKVHGQDKEGDVHTNKVPSEKEEEAKYHMDLCLEYMNIVDKQLVDLLPKFIITMLVFKLLDFLEGGNKSSSSLLRKVQNKIKQEPEEYLARSHAQQQKIDELLNRKNVNEETLKVIEETSEKLNELS